MAAEEVQGAALLRTTQDQMLEASTREPSLPTLHLLYMWVRCSRGVRLPLLPIPSRCMS